MNVYSIESGEEDEYFRGIVPEFTPLDIYYGTPFGRPTRDSMEKLPMRFPKNMDKLCAYFHTIENYPEYYLGTARRVAICKDPSSGKEYWYNGDRCLSIENPKKGSRVTVSIQHKNALYKKEFLFQGWVRFPVHEWKMKNGSILQLEQKFIDGLLSKERRFLRMYSK